MSSQERTRFWEELIAEWQSSGQSGQAFCKTQNLVYHQFVYWRRKLLETDGTVLSCRSDLQGGGFARVSQAMSMSSAPSDSELTVSLPGGITITGLHASNVNLLGGILRQL